MTILPLILGSYYYTLSCNSATFSRPNGNSVCYYYQAIRIETYTNGTYAFISNSSTNIYGYLYNNSFDPSSPSQNLITPYYESNSDGQFQIAYSLKSYQRYILVVATYAPDSVRGSLLITAVGPSWVYLYSITVTTSKLISSIIPLHLKASDIVRLNNLD
jgi:hypothetical protein